MPNHQIITRLKFLKNNQRGKSQLAHVVGEKYIAQQVQSSSQTTCLIIKYTLKVSIFVAKYIFVPFCIKFIHQSH